MNKAKQANMGNSQHPAYGQNPDYKGHSKMTRTIIPMGRLPVEDEGWQKQGTASNHEEDEGPRSLGDKMPGTIYTRDVGTAPSGLVDSEKATNPRGSTVYGAGARPTEGPEPGELR